MMNAAPNTTSTPTGPLWQPEPPSPWSAGASWPAATGILGVRPERAGELADWFDRCENEPVHPKVVEDELRRAGWHPGEIAAAVAQYRRRFNEHPLGYSALLVATGMAALAAGTVGHMMTTGVDQPINRNALAVWLSMLVCSLPFAVWAHVWAAKVDRTDPVAVWSQSRRTLALVLLWAAGIVGIGRLVVYAARLIGTVVHATWAGGESVAAGTINVAITVGIALPLGLWAFHFLHRFDDEDPSVPMRQRLRTHS